MGRGRGGDLRLVPGGPIDEAEMGFLDWIFGKATQGNAGRQQESWTSSERGNAMMLVGDQRITVFEDSGRGWKFCIADATGDEPNPYYSDRYDTENAAKYEALAHYKGLPSRYQSKVEQAAGRRAQKGK